MALKNRVWAPSGAVAIKYTPTVSGGGVGTVNIDTNDGSSISPSNPRPTINNVLLDGTEKTSPPYTLNSPGRLKISATTSSSTDTSTVGTYEVDIWGSSADPNDCFWTPSDFTRWQEKRLANDADWQTLVGFADIAKNVYTTDPDWVWNITNNNLVVNSDTPYRGADIMVSSLAANYEFPDAAFVGRMHMLAGDTVNGQPYVDAVVDWIKLNKSGSSVFTDWTNPRWFIRDDVRTDGNSMDYFIWMNKFITSYMFIKPYVASSSDATLIETWFNDYVQALYYRIKVRQLYLFDNENDGTWKTNNWGAYQSWDDKGQILGAASDDYSTHLNKLREFQYTHNLAENRDNIMWPGIANVGRILNNTSYIQDAGLWAKQMHIFYLGSDLSVPAEMYRGRDLAHRHDPFRYCSNVLSMLHVSMDATLRAGLEDLRSYSTTVGISGTASNGDAYDTGSTVPKSALASFKYLADIASGKKSVYAKNDGAAISVVDNGTNRVSGEFITSASFINYFYRDDYIANIENWTEPGLPPMTSHPTGMLNWSEGDHSISFYSMGHKKIWQYLGQW